MLFGPEEFSGLSRNGPQGPVSRKSRKLFGREKPFVKVRPASSGKPVFSYVLKGIKIKINAKFRASRRLRSEDTKRIMSLEKFRDFPETGPQARSLCNKETNVPRSRQTDTSPAHVIRPLLLRARVVVRTSNMKISRRRLADYVKTLHQKECCTCSIIIFLHSTNQVIDLWSFLKFPNETIPQVEFSDLAAFSQIRQFR